MDIDHATDWTGDPEDCKRSLRRARYVAVARFEGRKLSDMGASAARNLAAAYHPNRSDDP